MARAEATVTHIRPDQEPPETSYVQAGLVETQHADALRTLGDLTAVRTYAQQSVDAAAHSHQDPGVSTNASLPFVMRSAACPTAARPPSWPSRSPT